MLNAASAADRPRTEPADLIFVHGNIYTGLQGTPRAQAIAVRGERIVAVGSDAEIRKLKGKHTRVVDFGGHFVMPGFNDAHAHLAAGGLNYLQVNLLGVRSLDDMKARIAEWARKTAAGEWLVGRGWDETMWPESRLPTRHDMDSITAGHPAVFQRVDGHLAVLNSAGLQANGITAQTADPPGGKIDRDSRGEPTGIVRESVRNMVLARLPHPSPAQRRRGIELALSEAARWGITSVQDSISIETDPTEWENFLVYEDLEREGKLTARISEWLPFDDPLELVQKHRARHQQKDPALHIGVLKAYLDGALGSRTAAMLAPYYDDPNNTGVARYDQRRLDDMAIERVRSGFQLGFHAIGDRAVQMALDAFADAERDARERGETPARGFRFRVEHAQVTNPEQVRRFKELGAIASMQPSHLLTDMHWAEARLGKERAARSYAWREFLDAGVPLAFGTDYPVEPITPFRGLYAAVTRRSEDGKQEYFPAQKLPIDEAIEAYTTGAAYAEFAEREKGKLDPGMLADFVVLDRDITNVAPPQILKTQVLRTVVGGKTVYELGH